MLKTPNF